MSGLSSVTVNEPVVSVTTVLIDSPFESNTSTVAPGIGAPVFLSVMITYKLPTLLVIPLSRPASRGTVTRAVPVIF